jgi:hypothetical protein
MFDNDEGTVSTPPVPCAYAGSEFLLNANSEGQAQHHVLPNCGRKRAPSKPFFFEAIITINLTVMLVLKLAIYCQQGSGTLRQQLTILHVLHILHILHILHYFALFWTILHYIALT